MCKSAAPLVRKPDARKSHIRFDERDLETEETVRYSDTDKPKGSETQLRLNLIPPRQISTLPPTQSRCAPLPDPRSPGALARNWHLTPTPLGCGFAWQVNANSSTFCRGFRQFGGKSVRWFLKGFSIARVSFFETVLKATSMRAIPRTVWMLGFVSLFMDMSSELVHSLLPVFLVSTLGASVMTVGVIEGLAEAAALLLLRSSPAR